jgi:VanZ family protein
VLILVACWIPPQHLAVDESTGGFLKIPNLDKVVHTGIFFVFAVLWMRLGTGRRWAMRVLIGGVLLAIISELGQELPFVGRDAGVMDTLADVAGVVLGIVAYREWVRRVGGAST